MEIINPATKHKPKLNKEYYDKAIKQLNESNSYPVIINIGSHIMNSFTQDTIEKDIRKTGYYNVRRRLDSNGRYEVLEVNYSYA